MQEMIDKIYKEIANKELPHLKITELETIITVDKECSCYVDSYIKEIKTQLSSLQEEYTPVLIWDVLDYLEIKNLDVLSDIRGIDVFISEVILDKWKKKRRPIEEQSIECIKFVFDKIEPCKK